MSFPLHADRPISSGKQRGTKYRFPLRRGRNRIGRREKWPKLSWEEGEIGGKVGKTLGRREKLGEGE